MSGTLAGHNLGPDNKCTKCGKKRFEIIAEGKCCVGTNSSWETKEIEDARKAIWDAVMDAASAGTR